MENLLFIANIVVPVFIIVALGYFLRIKKLINDNFVSLSSKIVFSVSLPVLIFIEISQIDLDVILDFKLILFVYAGTIISFLLIWFISAPFIKNGRDRASFIQGSFRGNFAIVGLALILNIYGPEKLGKASLVLAFTVPLYNVLAVIALTVPVRKEKNLDLKKTVLEIIKNPLILGVLFALPFSYFKIPVNDMLLKSANYIAALALPLALLGIGGFLNFADIKERIKLTLISTVIKIVLIPLAATFAAYKFGFTGDDLGIIFILFACPTAIASFIMAEAMGVNSKLAGNILLITTMFSVFTIAAGLFILRENGLI
ncbi:MAG TPA: AEC family transporter [Ignavibacteriaceae bacterium]|nr:AEC family transporter [Ignavibacteriaceae bacterium]